MVVIPLSSSSPPSPLDIQSGSACVLTTRSSWKRNRKSQILIRSSGLSGCRAATSLLFTNVRFRLFKSSMKNCPPARTICACLRLTAWCGMTIWHSFSSRPITSASPFNGIVLFGDAPSGDFSRMSDGMGSDRRKVRAARDRTTTDVTAAPPLPQAPRRYGIQYARRAGSGENPAGEGRARARTRARAERPRLRVCREERLTFRARARARARPSPAFRRSKSRGAGGESVSETPPRARGYIPPRGQP